MAFPRRAFLITVLVLCICLPHIKVLAVNPDEPTQNLIKSICYEIEDYEFCNNIIHKNLKTPTTNLKDLTYLILTIAIEQASDTYIFIGNILRGRPGPEETIGLTTCLATYNIETSTFIKIRYEFSVEEYDRMIDYISSTTNILYECKTDFPIPPSKVNPLIEKNREMRILITMATVSGYMVKNENPSLLSLMARALLLMQF